MKVTRHTHPELWNLFEHEAHRWLTGYQIDSDKYEKFRSEAEATCQHLSAAERDAWAVYNAINHPGHVKEHRGPVTRSVVAQPEKTRSFYWPELVWRFAVILLLVLLVARSGHCQVTSGNVTIVTRSKGTTSSGTPTSTNISANTQGLDVNVVGGSTGGTSMGDLGTFTQGTTSFTPAGCIYNTSITNLASGQAGALRCTPDRHLFVNLGQLGGTSLTGANVVDGTNTAFRVNCIVGCSAAGDTTTGSTALGALNATISLTLAGERGAAFQLQSGGTGVYTVTPQCSFDGGTTYPSNGYIQDPFTGAISTTATVASGQGTTTYPVMCPQGSSHAQMKVTSYTSGTANWLARSTVITWPEISWGVVTTSAPTYTTGQISPFSLTIAGGLRVDGSGVTQPVSGTVTANQGGTWTVQPGNTANTTAWLVTGTGGTFPATQSGTWTVQQGTPPWSVVGNVASGATDSGNPVKTGYVFNTTQPTVTTGQRVDAQGTARGAAIVATGTDTFNVTVNAALPAGANTIGTVNAAQSGTWTVQPGNTANTTPWLVSVPTWAGGTLGAMANYGTSPGAVLVPGVNAFITNTPTVTANAGTGTFTVGGTVTANAGTGNFTVVGNVASGAADSGNPVKIGGVFNTTLPTLTTGQRGDAQLDSSARLLVAQPTASALNATVSGTVTVNQGTPTNWATNVAQFGGTNISTGTGAGGLGIPRVTISNDSSLAANQSVNTAQIGGSAVVADPCQQLARSSANISLTAGGQIITGAASKQTYICSMDLITATAQNIALVEGTGTVCATGIAGMAGGTTAATGWNFSANGGFVKGNGAAWVFKTAVAADNVCLLLSGTGQTSGSMQYVQQ